MESRDTDTRALSSDVKGLLKIDTDQPAGSGGDSALNFSQSSGKASKSSTIRNWPQSGSSSNLDRATRQQAKGRGYVNINECGVQNTKLNGYNDDISVDSDDNSRNDKNRSPGPSREITRDWDMDASTLSDASEKLQTLVNYLKQKEAQIRHRASHEPMTPEMAQELSDRLSGPLALLSDMSRGVREDNSAEGNMSTIHEDQRALSAELHRTRRMSRR